jgi:uncharacterized protein YciI
MKPTRSAFALLTMVLSLAGAVAAETPAPKAADVPPGPPFDAALAAQVGADEHGMRHYVLVVLKSSPNRVPDGKERDEMFQGHFANMKRLADAGKLALAGPFDGVDGWRGLFIFAVSEIEEAKALVASDPVVAKGEMIPEFHKYFGSAALMLVNDAHKKVQEKSF